MLKKNFANQTTTVFKASLASFALASFAISLQACSLFSMKADSEPTDPTFHATASSDQMPTVFPVEIADDINKLAKGQSVDPSNGWQKTEVADADEDQDGDEAPGDEVRVSFKRGPANHSTVETPPMKFKREGANRVYTVRHGDTLMKISYEAFGNVYRWKEIYEKNKGKIANYNAVPVGTVLTINGVEYVKIERNGIPYLIRRHDTLTKISKGLYGTPTYWKNLWANNRMLIHDPNKIYAGFTLYYKEKPQQMSSFVAKSVRAESKE